MSEDGDSLFPSLSPSPAGGTSDRLLGGRVRLGQPGEGFRAAIDPVFLAASVPIGEAVGEAGARVLDLGTGTGAAALCLAGRVADARVVGLDLQADLIARAQDNVRANGFEDRVEMLEGDLLRPPPALAPGSFDHVMANPPYLAAGTASLPPDGPRAAAVAEGEADLAAWVRFATIMVRPRGTITFVHRADRLDDLIAAFHRRGGDLAIYPLWPRAGVMAKRVLVQARRGSRAPLRLLAGMALHEADGRFTAAAEAVLRDGQSVALGEPRLTSGRPGHRQEGS